MPYQHEQTAIRGSLRSGCWIILVLAFWGCSASRQFAPPPQFEDDRQRASDALWQVVRFDGERVAYPGMTVEGVVEEDGNSPWRWIHRSARFRFLSVPGTRASVEVNVTVVDATLAQTGPVTVSLLVNGTRIGSKRYNAAGEYFIQAPVPANLPVTRTFDVTLEVDPPWISPSDHNDLGVILSNIGLRSTVVEKVR